MAGITNNYRCYKLFFTKAASRLIKAEKRRIDFEVKVINTIGLRQ